MTFICTAHVRSSFDRRGIPYTKHHQRSRVQITQCFDEMSQEGTLVVDFLTHVVKFKETASAELYTEVMDYIAGSDSSGKSGEDVFFNNEWDAVVVSQ